MSTQSKQTNADIMGEYLLQYQSLAQKAEAYEEEHGDIPEAMAAELMEYASLKTGSRNPSAPISDMAHVEALLQSLAETGLDGKLTHSKGIISAAWVAADLPNPPVNVLANDSPTGLGAGLFLCQKGARGAEQESYLMVVNNNHTGAALLVGDAVVRDSLRDALSAKGITYVKRGEPGAAKKISGGLDRVFEGATPVSYMPLTLSELVGFAFTHQGLEQSRFSDKGFAELRDEGIAASRAREGFSKAALVKFLAEPGKLERSELTPALTDGAEFDGLQKAPKRQAASKVSELAAQRNAPKQAFPLSM